MSSLDHVDAMNVVTPDGRAGNAWRHGARARRVAVREEDRAEFDQLHDALVAELRPPNVTAWLLVDHLARLQWRLGRAGGRAAGAFGKWRDQIRYEFRAL